MPDAVIFDLDGVLLDSEQRWNEIKRAVTEEKGGTWREDAPHAMMGMSSPEWSAYIHDELDVPLSPQEINDEVVRRLAASYEQDLPLLPGAVEAVRGLAGRWPLGLASSSNREVIDHFLELTGLEDAFAVTLSSEQVDRGKPAPDVYLECARRLDVEPDQCVAIEDSSNGIRAAAAAGMTVIAVPNPHYPPDREALTLAAATIDEAKLEAFMGQAVTDMGAIISAPLMVIGEKLGLYKAMAHAGPLSSQEVADRAGVAERSVREWLRNQAAGGYVEYDAASDRYTLPDEQAMALADEDSPVYVLGVYDSIASLYADEEKILEAFRSGEGMGWHEHDPRLFHGTERFFKPGYRAHLVEEWIPALDGVQAKLEAGAKVADIGCGHGASTVIMAEAFPNSQFTGFDYHDGSIEQARQRAESAGVGERVKFETASAADYPGEGYDLVTVFDCLHDMGDPVGASAHVHQSLAPDGTWMIVEPYANDAVEDNLNPVGRVFYGASTVICTPASLDQEVGLALGAQAGEARLAEVIKEGGFSSVTRATETPFNLVLEARP